MKKLLSSLVVFALVVSFSTTGISAEPTLPPLPGDPPVIVPKPVIVKGEISITDGWNLIAMPVLPVESYTVRRFIKEVEKEYTIFPFELDYRADINGDGVVDQHDLAIFEEAYSVYVNHGDINGDGVANEFDLEVLHQVIQAIEEGLPVDENMLRRADVNDDGRVDRKDIELLEYALEYVVDLNGDGMITQDDLELLKRYVEYLQHGRVEWRISMVAVYKDGRFKNLPQERYSYNMVPGEAYFVYAEYVGLWPDLPNWHPRKTVTIKGRALSQISYHLNRGWNGMSLPKEPPVVDGNVTFERFHTASDLSKKLVEQGIKATRVAFWSADNQDWVIKDLPIEDPVFDNPFEKPLIQIYLIRPDEGFFLLCEENGLFIPGLSLLPPFPPKRLTYTGKVCPVPCYAFGPPPPYTFDLRLDDGTTVHLEGANEETQDKLMEACQDDKYRVVEGVMTVMMNYNGNPNQGYPVDVLVVDKVKPIIYLPETNLVLLAKRDLCERLDIAEDDIVYFYYTDMEYTQYGFVSSCFIGLVYNAKTYLYKGTRSGHDGLNYSYNAEYIGMRDVEFDDEGNLILVDIKGKE